MARTAVKKTPNTKLVPRKNKGGRPVKANEWEIEERRKEVLRLRMRGLGYRTIAKALGVGHMTVKRDLEAIRAFNVQKVAEFRQQETIGECLSAFEEVELRSWEQYYLSIDKQDKARFLNLVQQARNNQIKLLTEVGLIKRAGQDVNVKVEHKVIEHWTPEAQNIVAMAIIKSKLTPAQEPVADEEKMIEAHAEPAQQGASGNK